jgi:Protein of unknown function (DUF1501)
MSQILNRRNFLKASVAIAGFAAAMYYGLDLRRGGVASARTGILPPATISTPTTIPIPAQIPHVLRRAGFGGSPIETANDTTIVTFTDFGRRLKENGNKGADHGAAQPIFMIGGQFSGDLYSTYPSLTNLYSSGNLQYNVGFRQVVRLDSG